MFQYLIKIKVQFTKDMDIMILSKRIIYLYEGVITLYILTNNTDYISDFGRMAKNLLNYEN